jgi:hypothetical protein
LGVWAQPPTPNPQSPIPNPPIPNAYFSLYYLNIKLNKKIIKYILLESILNNFIK